MCVSREAARKLIQLRQDPRRVADYAVDFRTLAAENQEALFDMFQHGGSEEVKDKLAAWELPTNLNNFLGIGVPSMGWLWKHRLMQLA